MRSNLKYIFFWVVTTIFCGNLIAQSKKEQILILSNKLDSLNSVLNKERSLSLEKIKTLNSEIGLTEKKLGATNVQITEVSNQLYYSSKEIEALNFANTLLELELFSLQKENSSLKLKVDSALKSSLTIEMVYVEGGTFQMGNYNGLEDEKPVHRVTLSSFYIGKYEVTQSYWKAIMGNNPSHFANCDNCPVENVSWIEIQEFILKLNQQTGKNYRLPTEAEWEYSAKGGKYSKGFNSSGSNNSSLVGWQNKNSGGMPHKVGTKQSNELGIYDMTGNVWEICSDWLGDYSNISQTNPTGSFSGFMRVQRGGCWSTSPDYCVPTTRGFWGPDFGEHYSGFRLVLPVNH